MYYLYMCSNEQGHVKVGLTRNGKNGAKRLNDYLRSYPDLPQDGWSSRIPHYRLTTDCYRTAKSVERKAQRAVRRLADAPKPVYGEGAPTEIAQVPSVRNAVFAVLGTLKKSKLYEPRQN